MGNAASTPNPPLLSALLLDPSPLIGGHIKTSTYQGEEEEGRGQGEEEGGGGGGGGLNVDFVGVEENGGWAWVADTVGHSWPEHKRPLAQKIEKHWEEAFLNDWKDGPFSVREESRNFRFLGPKSVSWERAKKFCMDFTFKMSDAFENMAISSTFTLVSLVNYKEEHYSWEKKKGLISIQVGDSGAVRFTKKVQQEGLQNEENNEWICEPLTEFLRGEVANIELAGDVRKAVVQIQQVTPGDIIIGGTDGVWNPLLRKYGEDLFPSLSGLLSSSLPSSSPQAIAKQFGEMVHEAVRKGKGEGEERVVEEGGGGGGGGGGKGVMGGRRRRKGMKGDDVAIFVVKVPPE